MLLLPLIEEYDISGLKTQCEDILIQEEPSLDILLIGHEYNMPKVIEHSVTACSSLSLTSIDHKKNIEIANHIPEQYFLEIYR